jgi:hypothetical protein
VKDTWPTLAQLDAARDLYEATRAARDAADRLKEAAEPARQVLADLQAALPPLPPSSEPEELVLLGAGPVGKPNCAPDASAMAMLLVKLHKDWADVFHQASMITVETTDGPVSLERCHCDDGSFHYSWHDSRFGPPLPPLPALD